MLAGERRTLPGRAVTSLRLRVADAADVALGRRDKWTPPRRLRNLVTDFHAAGDEIGRCLRGRAGLKPSDRVLDIGCGPGRVARILVHELQPPGSYDGFDVMPGAIAWCRTHYRDTPVPFRFEHADIHNSLYNESGAISATEYRFPYPDLSFDLVVATSVFTHLRADAAEHYLAEAARVLAPGGRLFSTWLLMEPGRVREHAGPAMTTFERTSGPEATTNPALPESAVAYDADWVCRRLDAHRLRMRDPIHWGTWAAGQGAAAQDIVVAHVET